MTDPPRPAPPFCSTAGKLPVIAKAEGGPDLWVRGEGASFQDRSGRIWLDFDLCLGSVVWGHGRAEIVAAAFAGGGAPTVPSAVEADAAQALLARLSRFEEAIFFKTGSDACAAAVRLARHVTGRERIVSDGYHGWHDWGIAGAYPDEASSIGVPKPTRQLTVTLAPARGLEAALAEIEKVAGHVAALVLRPEAWPGNALLALLAAGRRAGAVAICDEVTSHLKYSRKGSAALRGAEPDMICIGKGLANGLPIAALLGPRAILGGAGQARISSTNSSEAWSLAGMVAAESLLARAPVWPSWGRALAEVAASARTAIEETGLAGQCAIVSHPGFFSIERPGIPFRADPFRRHLIATLGRRGLYSRGWFHGSDAHDADAWARLEEAIRTGLSTWRDVS